MSKSKYDYYSNGIFIKTKDNKKIAYVKFKDYIDIQLVNDILKNENFDSGIDLLDNKFNNSIEFIDILDNYSIELDN